MQLYENYKKENFNKSLTNPIVKDRVFCFIFVLNLKLIIMRLCKITTNKSGIAKAFNLDFDTKFGYYIGNAYKDNKGNYLPTFMYYNGNVFELKYIDGCFNPYLNMLDKKEFGIVVENAKVINVLKANTPKLQQYYQNVYGQNFSMI